MIERTCSICGEYTSDVWTYVLSDEKDKKEWSGHKSCIDQIEFKVKSIKDWSKKPVTKLLKEIKF